MSYVDANETNISKVVEDWTYSDWVSFLGIWVVGSLRSERIPGYVEKRPFMGRFLGYVTEKDGKFLLLEGGKVRLEIGFTLLMQAVNP